MTVGFRDAVAPVVRRISDPSVGAGAGALLGAKFLDAATTWYALRRVPAAYERNPIAARIFGTLGLEWGMLLLGLCTVLVLVAAVEAGTYVLRTRTAAPDGTRRVLVYIGYVSPSVLFVAIAVYNCRVLY